MKHIWTEPYFGITHTGDFKNGYWASVEKRGENFYSCAMFFPGCKFSPHVREFASEELAKAAGEEFLKQYTF